MYVEVFGGWGKYVFMSEGVLDDYGCMFVFGMVFFCGQDGHGIIVWYLGQCGDVVHV